MTTHEVLVKARGLIERERDWAHGWNELLNSHRRCMVTAVSEASGGCCFAATISVLSSVTDSGAVFGWNDAPERTHAEVLAAFDKAIQATAPEPDTSFLNEVRVEEPVAS